MYFISYKYVVGSNCQLAFFLVSPFQISASVHFAPLSISLDPPLVTNFVVSCTSVYFINCLTALLDYIFLTTLVLQLLAETSFAVAS